MATHKKHRTPIEVIGSIVASEKISTAKLEDVFEDLSLDQIREWIDALEEFVSAYDEAQGHFETWQYAEGREEKSEARDELLQALEQTVNNTLIFEDLTEIPDLGLTPVASNVESSDD